MRQRAAQIGVVFHDFPLGGSERIAIRLMNRRAESGRKVVAFCGAVRGPLVDLIDREVDVVECAPAIPRAPSVVTQISTPLHRHGRGPIEQFAYNLLTRHRLRNRDAAIALSPSVIGQADDVLDRQITQYIRLPVLDDTLHPRTLTASRPGVAGRVELVGYVPDISPWLRQARLLLLSSYYEGFGAVLVEALATGRPVVSTDCTPAIKDILIRLPGCLVALLVTTSGWPDALDRALADVAPDPRPRRSCANRGQAARQ